MVPSEPWVGRDKAMIDLIKSIGLEKGTPFNPDAATRKTLAQAAAETPPWLAERYDTSFNLFYTGKH
jgi:hypothetical protein